MAERTGSGKEMTSVLRELWEKRVWAQRHEDRMEGVGRVELGGFLRGTGHAQC